MDEAAGVAVLDMATLSHLGHVRQCNQDYFYTAPALGLAMVADGVGGQGDGAWASHRAIRLFADNLEQGIAIGDREDAIRTALTAANTAMLSENSDHDGKASGTTVAGIWAPQGAGGEVTAFNVGDSSVFLSSGGALAKVSRDHSLYQMWVDGGRQGKPPARRTIMQAIGITPTLAPHFNSFRVEPGAWVLICTDGLTGTVGLEEIADTLRHAKSSRDACEALLSTVLEGPAPDNVTISVCRFP